MAQIAIGRPLAQGDLLLAVYLFAVIALTALAVERVWSERLNRVVTLIIAPILVAVGLRFLLML